MIAKILTWLGVIVAVLWVVKNPTGTAAFAQQVGHALSTLAGAL
jgi:hypothetical protein